MSGASDTMFRFGGGKACTEIEVAPFTPICDKPAVPGSEPLALEVPAPVFVPIVPPQECACFAFKDGKANVTVTMEAGHGSGTGTASVGIAATGDCCNGAYEVTPTIAITVPECVTADHVIYSNTTNLGYGGSITCTLGIRDCVPYFEMSSVPVSVTLPNIPNLCLKTTKFSINASYTAANGTTAETTPQEISLKNGVDSQTQCQTYTVENSAGNNTITLDLTGLPTGGFGNGGSVFKASGGNLYLDGAPVGNTTWYGGGLGNTSTDAAGSVPSRGPLMRGRQGNNEVQTCTSSGTNCSAVYPAVPQENSGFRLIDNTATQTATKWASTRKTTAGGADSVGYDTDAANGNLSVSLPTGFQWHERGIALNLSQFLWAPGGMLSKMEETGKAALVSPPPAVDGTNNISGLAFTDAENGRELGLIVNDGNGLRIHGVDEKTENGDNSAETGMLEVYGHDGDFLFNYNGKMVINDAANDSNTQERDVRVKTSANGSFLGTYNREGDCTVSVVSANTTSTDYWGSNGNGLTMMKRPTTAVTSLNTDITGAAQYKDLADGYIGQVGTQSETDAENMRLAIYELVAVVGYLINGLGNARSALATLNGLLGSLGIARMHFGKAGMLLSADSKTTCADSVTAGNLVRHYVATAPSS